MAPISKLFTVNSKSTIEKKKKKKKKKKEKKKIRENNNNSKIRKKTKTEISIKCEILKDYCNTAPLFLVIS